MTEILTHKVLHKIVLALLQHKERRTKGTEACGIHVEWHRRQLNQSRVSLATLGRKSESG